MQNPEPVGKTSNWKKKFYCYLRSCNACRGAGGTLVRHLTITNNAGNVLGINSFDILVHLSPLFSFCFRLADLFFEALGLRFQEFVRKVHRQRSFALFHAGLVPSLVEFVQIFVVIRDSQALHCRCISLSVAKIHQRNHCSKQMSEASSLLPCVRGFLLPIMRQRYSL